MKKIISLSVFILALAFISCETVIDPNLELAEPVLVVDAWLTAHPKDQIIKLSQTQPYFQSSAPVGLSSAIISLKNETDNRTFTFLETATVGNYRWQPASATDSLGQVGDQFTLSISVGSDSYTATAKIGRVPKIDSITFTYQEASGIIPENYLGEFWAKDPAGTGDAYWIKAWKNDTLLLKPSEINLAFDAGFTEAGGIDGITFISPIRQGISPFEVDDDGTFISPYMPGDSVYVEIISLNRAAFNFLYEVSIQTDRPGGFAELFASPFANVPTNIFNTNANGKKAVGFFNIGMVDGLGKKFVE
jgi:hypothetical protein